MMEAGGGSEAYYWIARKYTGPGEEETRWEQDALSIQHLQSEEIASAVGKRRYQTCKYQCLGILCSTVIITVNAPRSVTIVQP